MFWNVPYLFVTGAMEHAVSAVPSLSTSREVDTLAINEDNQYLQLNAVDRCSSRLSAVSVYGDAGSTCWQLKSWSESTADLPIKQKLMHSCTHSKGVFKVSQRRNTEKLAGSNVPRYLLIVVIVRNFGNYARVKNTPHLNCMQNIGALKWTDCQVTEEVIQLYCMVSMKMSMIAILKC